MAIGKGTKSGKELRGFVEEIESHRERKKQIGEAEKAIFAQAKAGGFDVKTIRKILTLRTQDPNERNKAQDLLDTYMHALGMAEPPELFKTIGALAVDRASREALLDCFKSLVPTIGEIVLRLGGNPVRIFRDRDGTPQAEDIVDEDPADISKAKPIFSPGADVHEPSGTARVPKKSAVHEAADRAEAAAKAKRAAAEPAEV